MSTKNDDLLTKIAKAKKEDAEKHEKERKKENQIPEVDQLKTQLAEMTEMGKRAVAETQNMKRRFEEDKRQIITMANAGLLQKILPILDNFDRAIEHIPEGSETWSEGIKMSINQLHQVLKEAGVTEIETQSEKFNPDLHEALLHGPGEQNFIIEVLEKGYMLGDRVLRHAKVKVGNGET